MIRIEIKEISKGHAGISLEAEKTDSIEVLQLAIEKVRERVQQNGTLYQQLQQAMEQLQKLSAIIDMADITRLGEISLPKLSENMAPEDRRAINNYLMQLRDQTMYMLRNLDESNFSDAMRDKLTAMGLKME